MFSAVTLGSMFLNLEICGVLKKIHVPFDLALPRSGLFFSAISILYHLNLHL